MTEQTRRADDMGTVLFKTIDTMTRVCDTLMLLREHIAGKQSGPATGTVVEETCMLDTARNCAAKGDDALSLASEIASLLGCQTP